MSEVPSVGVGLVGAGFLAQTRARGYRQVGQVDLNLVAICSKSEARAQDFAKQHRIGSVYQDFQAFLKHPGLDAVDLCVPNHLHKEMAVAAAQAGKHVLCTKPMTAYVGQDLPSTADDAAVSAVAPAQMADIAIAEGEAMVDAAQQAGVFLAYGENWLHAPAMKRAWQLFQSSGGAVLEMRGWECHNGSHSPYAKIWRYTGGGALLRLGAHPVGSMLHWKAMEGRNRTGVPIAPVAVTAEVADLSLNPALNSENCRVAQGWVDVENWGCVVIQFEDGSRGVAYGSDNHLGGMESRLEISASNCHFKVNLSPNDMLRAYASNEQVFEGEYLMEKVDSRAGWSTPMPNEDWTSGQFGLCQDFAEAVAYRRPPLAEGDLGVATTRVLYAAYQAAAEGRRVTL